MTRASTKPAAPREKLNDVAHTIAAVVGLLQPYAPAIQQLRRADRQDAIGQIMDPVYAATLQLIETYNLQIAVARAALAKVGRAP
jgi:hypothetical protein